MNIKIYAGSIRPGGGLTVLKLVIDALASDPGNRLVVYTGAVDSSNLLQEIFSEKSNVVEKQLFRKSGSAFRYCASKIYFLYETLRHRTDVLISFNYYIPAFSRKIVYHINLLHFQRPAGERETSFFDRVKDMDARIACYFAQMNLFESRYLMNQAGKKTHERIRNKGLLYIGVDPDFYLSERQKYQIDNIVVVSSMQPHKDNATCIKSLRILAELQPSVDWKMIVVGGQSVEQWETLGRYAKNEGVDAHIEFQGPVPKPELARLMSRSLCLISASRVESFCMVALEAMAAGCPVVATNATSMPESIADAGITVPAGDANAFALSILEFYRNNEKRQEYIDKGMERAGQFSVDAFANNLRQYVREV